RRPPSAPYRALPAPFTSPPPTLTHTRYLHAALPIAPVTPSQAGGTATATNTVPGQNLAFTFSAVPGQRISYTLASTLSPYGFQTSEDNPSNLLSRLTPVCPHLLELQNLTHTGTYRVV